MALPERTNVLTTDRFPELPKSWSELTWQQLCTCWQVKMQYGGNADVARAAALLALTFGSRFKVQGSRVDDKTGEQQYILSDISHQPSDFWLVKPRELSQMAQQALPWFDYPYGDPGKEAVKDEKGKVIEEAVSPVRGYVSGMRDALILQEEETVVAAFDISLFRHFYIPIFFRRHFSLPQMACNNLTWQQYRSLQAITPQLFQEGISDEDALDLQAQFLAHCMTPRSLALLDTTAGSIRLRPHQTYQYDAIRAEKYVRFWKKQLSASRNVDNVVPILFHICFQAYQTALTYYAQAYPLLFSDDKKDTMNDALQGEVGTINTIMKYAGYSEQQQVYDSNLPFVLDILNKMATEAKEIENIKRHK